MTCTENTIEHETLRFAVCYIYIIAIAELTLCSRDVKPMLLICILSVAYGGTHSNNFA